MAAPRGVVRLVAQGGPGVGMGHLARCTALACALKLRGYSVVTQGAGLDVAFELDGITWATVSGRDRAEETVMTVLDGYGLTSSEAFEQQGPVVAMHPPQGHELRPIEFLDVGGRGNGGLQGLDYACVRRPF